MKKKRQLDVWIHKTLPRHQTRDSDLGSSPGIPWSGQCFHPTQRVTVVEHLSPLIYHPYLHHVTALHPTRGHSKIATIHLGTYDIIIMCQTRVNSHMGWFVSKHLGTAQAMSHYTHSQLHPSTPYYSHTCQHRHVSPAQLVTKQSYSCLREIVCTAK